MGDVVGVREVGATARTHVFARMYKYVYLFTYVCTYALRVGIACTTLHIPAAKYTVYNEYMVVQVP